MKLYQSLGETSSSRGVSVSMSVNKTTTIEASGQGVLTAEVLLEVLKDFPPNAGLNVKTDSSQRDGSWWRVTATVRG